MDAPIRARFNAAWTPELYRRVRADLERRLACPVPFPVAETPIFMPPDALQRFAVAAEEIVEQLREPSVAAALRENVPAAFRSDSAPAVPQFAQLDFAIVQEPDGSLGPRLIELQGFPSLYCFQVLLADVWATHISALRGLPDRWRLFFSGLDRYRALALLRETIIGGHEPEEVCLLDLDPTTQKTLPDFRATQRWFGVDPICLTEIVREGNQLFRRKEGRLVRIRRIYHRIVFDELDRSGKHLPFDVREELEVEWAPHPAWFFAWSKSSLIHLDHPAVPKTVRVSDGANRPDNLDGWVLKPLYSFAGGGVKLDPTEADLDAVPEEQRDGWVLQEKIEYVPALRSVEGHGVMAEIRMMFVRPDRHSNPILLLNLGRLSRGKMMGVDFNKDLSWTGASVAIWADWSV